MKKLTTGVLAGIMIFSAVQGIGAAEDWLTYGTGDEAIRYSTYTGSIKRNLNNSSTVDNPPAVNIKTVSIEVPTQINGTEIVAVEKNGFFDFDELKSMELPNTLTTLGEMAFYGADNLEKIVIPDKVETVSKACFRSCDSLSEVVFGKGVKTIGQQAFYSDRALESVSLNEGCESKEGSAFELSTKLKSVTLPSSLNSIGDSVFKSCSSLEKITVPSGVAEIASNTFSGCSSLKVVQINGNITSIGKNAFKDCGELTDIYIPESCKLIEDNAFDGCKKVRFHCDKGSVAETYAKENNITVVYDEPVIPERVEETVVPDTITVTLDGRELDFGNVEPQIINGSTMVPMRVIFEELGCNVNWNSDTKTVTASKGVTDIILTVGKKSARINKAEQMLDAAPCIVNGNTLVPVRFVSEALGVKVMWDQSTRTVSLQSE